jgi:branched-subunit amino acid aminotransferase/4-amino-4-deoxychorismate lyase
MMPSAAVTPRVEIDGRATTAGQLRAVALANYGHFTAMQVRDGCVRGLDLHLARLTAATQEVFQAGLDADAVRDHIRHALGADTPDASVRVYVHELTGGPSVMVTVRPPGGMLQAAWKLRAVPYQRSLAHIKHVGDFGQSYYQRLANRGGCDEALLTGPGGVVSEGSVTNIGFWDGTTVIWPDAPALQGITMQLLDRQLSDVGLTSRRAEVRVSDLGTFAGAFVTNARGIAAVGQVDGQALAADPDLMATLTQAYQSAGWDHI